MWAISSSGKSGHAGCSRKLKSGGFLAYSEIRTGCIQPFKDFVVDDWTIRARELQG
jgi:hypothetical protein